MATQERPAIYNLRICQNKQFDRNFQWKINGAAVDLSGYGYRFKLRDNATNVSVLDLNNAPDGAGNGVTLDSSGNVHLYIHSVTTNTFTFKRGTWELKLKQPNNEWIPFMVGEADLIPETASDA